MNHFKDELRRAFMLYALIPTFIIAVFIIGLAFTYWNTTVAEQNLSRLEGASSTLNTKISGLMEEANEIAALCDVDALRDGQSARTLIYERLYQYTNSVGLQTEFYLYDAQMNRLISNQQQDPEFVRLAQRIDWGIIGQLRKKPATPGFDFVSAAKGAENQTDLVIGKAILEKGRISGYIFFVLPEAQVLNMVANSQLDFVVTTRSDYAPIRTDESFSDALHKMKPEVSRADGYLSLDGRQYYVGKKEILHGELTVYALTSIDGIVRQLSNALLMLSAILTILSASIVVSVKRQVEEKTMIIDRFVEAFSAVKQGRLDMRLDVKSNNEFQLISDAYNMMLSSLQELMQNNHEKARATVISEIKQLESQFNPHFLFNTLENIKFMIKLEPDAASKMIVALSNLLRYSINEKGSEVTISEDMAYTRNYLEIQKSRFGQRLDYLIGIPQELENCIIPKLIIQPIIENAVKYGFRDCNKIMVKIGIRISGEKLVVSIDNNGAMIEPEELEAIRAMLTATHNSSEHSGLYNVNRRIKLMYGEEYGLEIVSGEADGTSVKMILPVRQQKNGAEPE